MNTPQKALHLDIYRT